MLRVLMTGGGTGGHVNPAIAIANTIKANVPDAQIAFVGTEHGIENKLVAAEGYTMYHVRVEGIKRSLSLTNLKALYFAVTSPNTAKKIIKEFKPDIVIGTGGYVSWPLLKAASMMKIPSLLHESNAIPGLTVKKLKKSVDMILLNFEESKECFPKNSNIVCVGNPLRNGFGDMSYESARKKLGIDKYKYFVLSYGGSGGAEGVNAAVLELMKDYGKNHPDVLFVHATGARDYKVSYKKFLEYGLDRFENLKLLEYIYDMALQMAAADVVISRAGAMTISELSLMKKSAILIPSPFVTNNHQYKNAEVLQKADAAMLIEESSLKDGALTRALDELLKDDSRRALMSANIVSFAKSDANKLVFNEIMKLIKKNRK